MKRRVPLERKAPLRRKTRLRPVNPKTGGKRFPKRRDPAYCAWIRTLPCVIAAGRWRGGSDCTPGVECAHVKTRGAGGDDQGNCYPACRRHHEQQHRWGIRSFEFTYNVDLPAIARSLAARYQQERRSA